MDYLVGEVIKSEANKVIIEVNNIGYSLCPLKSSEFIVGNVQKVYIFEERKEYTLTRYAFFDEETRDLFASLISVKGVGIGLASRIMQMYSTPDVSKIINNQNEQALMQIKGISKTGAKRIIAELSPKEEDMRRVILINSLVPLGFEESMIDQILASYPQEKNIEFLISKLYEIKKGS